MNSLDHELGAMGVGKRKRKGGLSELLYNVLHSPGPQNFSRKNKVGPSPSEWSGSRIGGKTRVEKIRRKKKKQISLFLTYFSKSMRIYDTNFTSSGALSILREC